MQNNQIQTTVQPSFSSIPGYAFALIGTKQVLPKRFPLLYHGTHEVDPQCLVANNGLPPKGSDIDLIRHIEPPPSREIPSAFRGTVPFPIFPAFRAGAAEWAGEGGWVFEVSGWPGYDIAELLTGNIPTGLGEFRSPLMEEQEVAIPAPVPREHITKVGNVVARVRGISIDWIAP